MDYSDSMFPSQAAFDAWFHTKVAFMDLPVAVSVAGTDSMPYIRIEGKVDKEIFCLQWAVPWLGNEPSDRYTRYLADRSRAEWDHHQRKNEAYVPFDLALVREWAAHRAVKLEVNDAWRSKSVMRFAPEMTLVVSPKVYHDLMYAWDPRDYAYGNGTSWMDRQGVSFIR